MLHPVKQEVVTVRRLAERLLLIRGVAFCLTIAVCTIFVFGMADYLLRFQDPGVRLLSTAVVVVTVAWAFWRFVTPALRTKTSNLDVARQIESRYPHLQDRLSSTIAFLNQSEDDPTAGSADLRKAVVATTIAEIAQLDFTRCLDLSGPRKAAIWSVVVCLVVVVVASVDMQSTALAAWRMALPLSEAPWPRRHELEFVNAPTRIAAGTDFEIELIDRKGNPPDDVRIAYWFDGEPQSDAQIKEMKFLNDRMVDRLENVTRGFQYRAFGGDDQSMPWNVLEVLEPVRVIDHEVQLHPPAYTGWPVESGGKNVNAVAGTRMAATGHLNKPAKTVVVKTDQSGKGQTVGRAGISADGLSFQIGIGTQDDWIVDQSCQYWFEIIDRDGLSGGGKQRWNLRVTPDSAPTVSLEKPGGNTYVTADAIVALDGMVKDDLAIHTIETQYRRSDHSDQDQYESIELYRGAAGVPVVPESGTLAEKSGGSQKIDHRWDLSKLAALIPGTWIEFHVAASDYKPQFGASTARRLTIITPTELEDRIAGRQSHILGQVAEVLRVQRGVRSQTKSLEIQLEETGGLAKSDIDQLQSAELNQRQVGRLLADPNDGVLAQIVALLDEMDSNRVDNPDVRNRMAQLAELVAEINHGPLPEIGRELINALKVARADFAEDVGVEPFENDPAVSDSISAAGVHQDKVITLLESLLGELSQWDNYLRFAREIGRARQTQEEIRQETEKIRLDALGKDVKDLDDQQAANLKRLSEKQMELARQFDKIRGRMEEMQVELQDDDPLASETLADALDAARRAAISGKMRESGRDIEDNQTGQASGIQREIGEDLRELLDTLANRREHELERQLKKLDEAATELKQLRQKQQELIGKMDDAANEADDAKRQRELERLNREMKELADETKRLARRLERLQAERASELMQEASEQMQSAGDSSDQGEAAKALEEASHAEKLLEEAEAELARRRQQAEAELQNEQMVRLEQQINGLVARQQSIHDTTDELEKLRAQQAGQLNRGQLTTVGDLARRQRELGSETNDLAERLAEAKAFVLGLRGVTREMFRAAKQLDRRNTDESVLRPQRVALARLQQLLVALAKDDNANEDESPPEDSGEGQENQGDPGGIQQLAQLKLLRLMQQEINRRTSELEEIRGSEGQLTEEQLREIGDLANEQGQLADLILDLGAPPPTKDPEDDPDSLPDFREDLDDREEEESDPVDGSSLDRALLEGL